MNEQFAKKHELQINEEASANIGDLNFEPIEKYQAAEYLYIYGEPITKIASLLNIDRKKLSLYLKMYGYDVKNKNYDSDSEKEELYKLGEDLFKEDYSLSKISQALNISKLALGIELKNKGYKVPVKNPPSKKQESEKAKKLETAEEMFLEDYPISEIREKLRLNRSAIVDYLQKKGYDTNKVRTYSVDETIFECIDTEEKAYWLGFLSADGSVQIRNWCLELGLQKRDYNHLVKFKEFLKTDAPITPKTVEIEGKEYDGYRICIHYKKLVQDLISKGCIPNKTLILKFPSENIVSKQLQNHFIRGYFDGDGSITIPTNVSAKFSLIGTKEFLNGVKQALHLPNYRLDNKGRAKELQITGLVVPLAFLYKIYSNESICLERKKQRYLEIVRKINFMNKEDLNRLAERFKQNEAIKDIAILYLIYFTGLSTKSICNLKRDSIVLDDPTPHLKMKKSSNLEFTLPIPDQALKYLQMYLDTRNDKSNALFISNSSNGPISQSYVNTKLRQYGTSSTKLRSNYLLYLLEQDFKTNDIVLLCSDYVNLHKETS